MKNLKHCLLVSLVMFGAVSAHAYSYRCKVQYSGGSVFNDRDVLLEIDSQKIKLIDIDNKDTYTQKVDTTYKPRAANANYVRFQYLDGPVSEGYLNVLAEDKLTKGKPSGKIKIQWGGEVFNQDVYVCKIQK